MLELVLIVLCVTLAVVAWRLHVNGRTLAAQHAAELAVERERHDEALHAETARLEAMLDGMIEGLLLLDAEGRITRVNQAAEAIFGFSRMMAGGTLLEAIRHHEVAAIAARAAQETTAVEHEIQLERPIARVLQISAVALRNGAGALRGTVLVVHDVTRLRQLEAMRQEFVANVSHELRTPLSLIKSAAETLLDGGKGDPAITTRFLEIIDKHANRLTLLIDDLLLLSRFDSERVELRFQGVPLRAAAQEALDEAALAAAGRSVRLENEVPHGLVARADPEQLRHVFGNLIGNAIKYGRPNGRVTVSGQVRDEATVELCVRDDGPGIPAEARARVFERFYRVDKARSRDQGGTGLGLSIVKHVVQAHGGEVRVESEEGQGAAFYFTLARPAE